MKSRRWFAGLLGLAFLNVACALTDGAERPNVILILADDLGYGDVGFNGCRDIPTPNLDQMAADGVRFSNGYSSHPFCSPMRAGMMAGRYQHRFGYVNNVAFDPHNQLMGLPVSERTVASRLRDSGYRTGMVGKWHLGAASPFHPMKRGFDFFYGFLGGGHDYFKVDTRIQLSENYKAALDDNGKPVAFDGYLTTALTDQAIRFIEGSGEEDQPYFLYVAYNAPHGPLQAPQEEIDRFKSIDNPKRRTYAAMVSVMDAEIGRILDVVERLDESDETLVIFLSDNGGPEHANASDNGPLRGQKGDVYEGGIHVPFLMRWKKTLPAATVYEHPVISLDISATALSLAGADPVPGDDGVNLIPFVVEDRDEPPHHALFWRTGRNQKRAVRSGNQKWMIVDGKASLFDLKADLGEKDDQINQSASVSSKMRSLFDSWNEKNKPAIFPGYRDYHNQLKAFHRSVRESAQTIDQDHAAP